MTGVTESSAGSETPVTLTGSVGLRTAGQGMMVPGLELLFFDRPDQPALFSDGDEVEITVRKIHRAKDVRREGKSKLTAGNLPAFIAGEKIQRANDVDAKRLWTALDESRAIVSGAWEGMAFEDLPEYVVAALNAGISALVPVVIPPTEAALKYLETIAALTRDAERYRFLRQPGNAIVYAKDRNAWGEGASGHVKYKTPEELDAAIDAAIGASPPREPCASHAAEHRLRHELPCPWCVIDELRRNRDNAEVLITREQFDAELRALGERKQAEGMPVIAALLREGDEGRVKCRFDNWPAHLKADAYKQLGVEPVERFRRTPDGAV